MKTRLATAAIAGVALYVSSTTALGQTIRVESEAAVLQPDVPGQQVNAPQLTPAQHQMLYEGYLARRHAVASQKTPLAVGPNDRELLMLSVPETLTEDPSENMNIQPLSPGSLYIGRNSIYHVVGDGQSTVAEPSIANSGANGSALRTGREPIPTTQEALG